MREPLTIWLIEASGGSYDGAFNYIVRWYPDESLAKAEAKRMTAEAAIWKSNADEWTASHPWDSETAAFGSAAYRAFADAYNKAHNNWHPEFEMKAKLAVGDPSWSTHDVYSYSYTAKALGDVSSDVGQQLMERFMCAIADSLTK